MGAVGGLFALAMITVLIGNKKDPNYMPLFMAIATFMAVSVLILVLTIKENKVKQQAIKEYGEVEMQAGEEDKVASAEKVPMARDVKKSLTFLLFSVALWYMAYNAVTTAFSRYCIKVLNVDLGTSSGYLLMATISAIIAFVPLGFARSIFEGGFNK